MAPRVVYNDGKTRRLIHENGEQEDELVGAVAADVEPLESSSPLVAAFSRYAGELIEACEARKQEAVAESDAVLTHTELRKLCREVAKLSDGPGLHAAPVEPLLQLVSPAFLVLDIPGTSFVLYFVLYYQTYSHLVTHHT